MAEKHKGVLLYYYRKSGSEPVLIKAPPGNPMRTNEVATLRYVIFCQVSNCKKNNSSAQGVYQEVDSLLCSGH